MASLTVSLSSPPLVQNRSKTRGTTSKSTYVHRNPHQIKTRIFKSGALASNSPRNHRLPIETAHPCRNLFNYHKTTLCGSHSQNQISNLQTLPNSLRSHLLIQKTASILNITATYLHSIYETDSFLRNSLKLQLSLALMAITAPFPCFASESTVPIEQLPNKINLESIIVSIDDFFNRNPFFVAGVTFIWLVVIPLTQEYLKKYKFIYAVDAFRKLRDDPNSQLLDIRDNQSLLYVDSPDLKILNKKTVQVQFSEGAEESFVKKVLDNFKDLENTTLCVLDNFDGNSMKVAELLFKNGFKEAYAIKGGLRGKDGWQAIQETLLPPSVRVYPKKKEGKSSQRLEVNEGINGQTDDNGWTPSSTSVPTGGSERVENGYIKAIGSRPQMNLGSKRPLSPYPNYPDMKPPSSPTPSKSQS